MGASAEERVVGWCRLACSMNSFISPLLVACGRRRSKKRAERGRAKNGGSLGRTESNWSLHWWSPVWFDMKGVLFIFFPAKNILQAHYPCKFVEVPQQLVSCVVFICHGTHGCRNEFESPCRSAKQVSFWRHFESLLKTDQTQMIVTVYLRAPVRNNKSRINAGFK